MWFKDRGGGWDGTVTEKDTETRATGQTDPSEVGKGESGNSRMSSKFYVVFS